MSRCLDCTRYDCTAESIPSALVQGWEDSFKNEHLPQPDPIGQVNGEDVYCCPTDWCASDKYGSLPLEVVFPLVLPRMKQADNFFRVRIYSGNVRSFVVVARKTREREVSEIVRPVMFTSNNVVNLEGQEVATLRHPAVLA